jgi:FKBP-type peptidyl-prolyl cis-trans isomerase SlyD
VKIGPDTVVSFHYTLRDESGGELETSRGGDPTAYLHGARNIIPGLESAMTDHETGDTFSVTINAEDAYGMPREDSVQRVPIKHLVYKGKLRAGDRAQLNTRDGLRAVTVVKAGRHAADIDTNHPLAGKTLVFEIEVKDIRAATAEEVSHGHAHGPGGHQH